ncbi:hypothetical protein [Streptomyces sp. NPDC046371]|uniref:hypothetical protein n=1 Tax=Streptomyces sp. NPDC046371 TaxID=3154916 RepID=UPI0033E2424E
MKQSGFRQAVVAVTAVALAAVVTGCQKGGPTGEPAGGAAAKPGAVATAPEETTDTPTAQPAVRTSNAPKTPTSPQASRASRTSKPSTPAAEKKPGAAPAAPGCVTAPPDPDAYDPDEFALYRVEELPGSTGKVNLVLQNGAWGCGEPDTDGAPFVVSGEESRWAMDQAAYVTATTPIVESTENRRIGVQELIDWVKAHPDSGLVFRYETGDDGAIHRLDQVFTP